MDLAPANQPDLDTLGGSQVKTADDDTIAKASSGLRKEYLDLQEELRTYRDLGVYELIHRSTHNGAESGQLTKTAAAQWEFVLREVQAQRRELSRYLVDHYKASLKERGERIREWSGDLKRYTGILQEIKQARKAVHLAEFVVELGEYAEIVEHASNAFIEEPEHIAVAMVADLNRRVGKKGELVKKGMENLADYYDQVALATEGVESLDELKSNIESTVDEIQTAVNQQADERVRLGAAQADVVRKSS